MTSNAVWNPSDMVDTYNLRAPLSLTASATWNLTTGIDVSLYEYVMVLATVGTTAGETTITCQESDTATVSGGGYAAISGKTMTFAATADHVLKALEVRCHGLKRYLNVRFAESAAGSCTVGCVVLGFGRQYSANYVDFTASTATLAMSAG